MQKLEKIERDFSRELHCVSQEAETRGLTGKIFVIIELNMATGGIAKADIKSSKQRAIAI